MAKSEYVKQLQVQIENLEDGFDIHGAELSLLESELKDVLRPTELLSELTQTHFEMLCEILLWLRKNKPTDRVLASKERLLKLIDIDTRLNGIGDTCVSLKAINKTLVAKMQLLRIENAKLRRELKNFTDATNF